MKLILNINTKIEVTAVKIKAGNKYSIVIIKGNAYKKVLPFFLYLKHRNEQISMIS